MSCIEENREVIVETKEKQNILVFTCDTCGLVKETVPQSFISLGLIASDMGWCVVLIDGNFLHLCSKQCAIQAIEKELQ